MMPTVNEANPAMRLCAARHRIGRNCPRGNLCKMIHDLDIDKWPDATFAKWAALVDKTRAAARATDDFVHEEPWKAVGVAAALGLALGVLIGRR